MMDERAVRQDKNYAARNLKEPFREPKVVESELPSG
jgi:hypothetical protein